MNNQLPLAPPNLPVLSLSPEEIKVLRRQMFFEPVSSRSALKQWIKTFLQIDLPDTYVDENSNSNPLDYVWSVYEVFLTNEGPKRHVVAAARNTMKSLTSAILHLLAMVHFRRSCLHFAAIRDQATVVLKYANKFMKLPELAEHFDRNNKNEVALGNLPPNKFTSKDDAALVIIATTLKQANSKRASYITADEVDQVDREILSEIAPVADPTQEGFEPVFTYLSSRKSNTGPVQDLIDEAEGPDSSNIRLHKWSLVDFQEKCTVVGEEPQNEDVYLNKENLQVLWGNAALDGMNQTQKMSYMPLKAYNSCRTCPAFISCQARAPLQVGKSKSLRTRNFVASILSATKDAPKIIGQYLNWRPESTGLVFANFSRARHVKGPREAYAWIAGKEYNPSSLGEEQILAALESKNFKERSRVVPDKYELYRELRDQGYKIHFGVDFGYFPDPAVCVVTAYNPKNQRCMILHTEAQNYFADEDWAPYIKEKITDNIGIYPDLVCPDTGANPAAPRFFAKVKMASRSKKPSRIETGVSQIRSLLWNPALQQTQLCVLADPSNEFIIKELMTYKHKKGLNGTWDFDAYDDKDNHACFIPNTIITTRQGIKLIKDIIPGDEVLTHLGNFKRVLATSKSPYKGKMCVTRGFGRMSIFSTPDHPFFIKEAHRDHKGKKTGQLEYSNEFKLVNADKITKTIKNGSEKKRVLILPVVKEEPSIIVPDVDLAEYIDFPKAWTVEEQTIKNNQGPKIRETARFVKRSKELTFLEGYFAAEGSYSKPAKQIQFAQHKVEHTVIPLVENVLKQFGVENVHKKTKENCTRLTASSAIALNYFAEMYDADKQKRLKDDYLAMPEQHLFYMVCGYLFGDGSFSSNGLKSGSISIELSYQIFHALHRLGFRPRIKVAHRRDRYDEAKDQYIVSLDTQNSQILIDKIEKDSILNEIFKAKSIKNRLGTMPSIKGCKYQNGDIGTLIQGTQTVPYDGFVYNMSVEDDNSYVANGVAVHNCDSLRYALDPFIQNASVSFARSQTKQYEDEFKILEQKSIGGKTSDHEQAAYVKATIERTYREEFGLTGIFDSIKVPLGYSEKEQKEDKEKKKGTIVFSFK